MSAPGETPAQGRAKPAAIKGPLVLVYRNQRGEMRARRLADDVPLDEREARLKAAGLLVAVADEWPDLGLDGLAEAAEFCGVVR